uniref:receptor protein-tyrosine kinase n=1 Tax=Acrobeloides nanus TaxID=290746 RepID=A0A914DSJ3_9BILA
MFNLPNGLAFNVIKPKGGNDTLGKPTSLSEQEILESIWKESTLKKERVENATLWMHDALKQYADENWVDGNQAQICAYMSTKFDETYGIYWFCSTSERNTNIYDYVNVDTKEGFIRFELKNGLKFFIFKAPSGNSKSQVKSLTREEISNSIIQPSTVLGVIKEDVITWLYESLKLYADDNWVEGNQNKICTDVGKKLDEKYEQYWTCMASPSNDHNIYGYNTYEQKDGLIYFDLPNGLMFQIMKSANNCSRNAIMYVIAYTMIAILLVTIIAMLIFFIGFISWQKLKIRKIIRQNELLSLSQANTGSLLLIPIDKLKIGKQKLGSGEFSDVFSGKYLIDDKKVNVAIKNIKDVNEQELIKEAGIMARLTHIHLTKLYGICLADGCKMVTPLRELGSLKSYLQSQKNKIKPSDLLQYCLQVASGMEYLAERSIVHRDLAARNVLMKSKKHVEITDFGLSSLTQTDITIPSKMPFFWVAIECLSSPKKNLYCEATDVWSFGVTCWEILTFAKRPYENVFIDRRNVLQSMCAYLNNGNRLVRPENCSLELYQTLLLCWAPRSYSRPRFKILKETFEKYCETPSRFVLSKSIGNDKSIIDLKNVYNEDDEKISGPGLYNDNSMRDESKKVENGYSDETKVTEKQDAYLEVIENRYYDETQLKEKQDAYLKVIEDSDEPPNPIRRYSDPSYLTVISDGHIDENAEKLRKCNSYIELINE